MGGRVAVAYILVPSDGLVDVARRELVQLLVVAEDDDGHVDGAEHGELVSLLEQAALALQEGSAAGQFQLRRRHWYGQARGLHGAVAVVLDGLDLDLSATHGDVCVCVFRAECAWTGGWMMRAARGGCGWRPPRIKESAVRRR